MKCSQYAMQGLMFGAVCVFLTCGTVSAVPPVINYQGLVESAGEPFSGTGYFRFALVDAAGTMTFWTNDGMDPPETNVTIAVEDGLFQVMLGDSTVMEPFPAGLFDDEGLYLRTWFDDGVTGLQLLAPDQRLTSTGYALRADNAAEAEHALYADDADAVGGYPYNSNWPTTLATIKNACANDFHNIGGEDDDQPDTDEEVPDDISINNGRLYSMTTGVNSVGINTTTPETALHVEGNITVDNSIFADDADGLRLCADDEQPGIVITDDHKVGVGLMTPETALHVEGNITVDDTIIADDSSGLKFATDEGLTRMILLDDGRVGVNTTTPLTALHVNGDMRLNGDMELDGNITLDQTFFASGASGFQFVTSDAVTRMLIAANGNVGIAPGGLTPETLLHVRGDITLDDTIRADDDSGIRFATADGSTRMTILDDGNVGIGTTSPDTKLHVNGDLTVDEMIMADDAGGLLLASDDGIARLIIADSGNVGIWNSFPETRLHVDGDVTIDDTLIADDSSGLRFATDEGTTRMAVADDGNVGIATTSPETTLHVNGDLTVDDTIVADDSGGLNFATDDGIERMVLADDGDVGIGTTSPGSHRLSVESSGGGASGSTGYFENTASNGIAMSLENDSTDCTLLLTQNYTGNIINGDSKYGTWHRVFVVEGDGATGIGTGSPSRMLFVNGDAGGTTAWYNDSDERLKKNIQTIPDALDRVRAIRGVMYEWIDPENHEEGLQIGFIGQELEPVVPEVVDVDEDGFYAVQYAPVTALLVEAVKEQQAMIERQQEQIEAQREQIELLKDLVQELMGRVSDN